MDWENGYIRNEVTLTKKHLILLHRAKVGPQTGKPVKLFLQNAISVDENDNWIILLKLHPHTSVQEKLCGPQGKLFTWGHSNSLQTPLIY